MDFYLWGSAAINLAASLLIGGLMLVYEPGGIKSPKIDALLAAAYRK